MRKLLAIILGIIIGCASVKFDGAVVAKIPSPYRKVVISLRTGGWAHRVKEESKATKIFGELTKKVVPVPSTSIFEYGVSYTPHQARALLKEHEVDAVLIIQPGRGLLTFVPITPDKTYIQSEVYGYGNWATGEYVIIEQPGMVLPLAFKQYSAVLYDVEQNKVVYVAELTLDNWMSSLSIYEATWHVINDLRKKGIFK